MSDERLIIVGAGAAGCVIAARVTEGPREVLLVEAGPDYPDPATLPHDLARARKNSMRAHDWGFRHQPNNRKRLPWPLAARPDAADLFPMPRGRVVGGSSAVNTCIALRGQPWDFQEWADRGLSDWSWEQCLPAFERLENDADFGDQEFHGNSGPLPIRRHPPHELGAWQAAFVQTCLEAGFPACPDSNHPNSHGTGPHAMNKVDGRRISAAEAWLTPEVRGRDNLTIQANTHVRRVLFEGRRAIGVEVEHLGAIEVLRGEVVLSAGAICTPGILMRSGVGPRERVEAINVDLVAHNAGVGSRLLDHAGTAIFLRPRLGSETHRRDPLIQTCLRYGSANAEVLNDMLLQPGSCVPVFEVDLPLISIMCHVGKPFGHGTIEWTSADPHARPIVRSRLLEDDRDRAMAIEAIQLARALVDTPTGRKMARHVWPPPRVLRNKKLTGEWVMKACDSGYHPSGTVPMGADDDPAAGCDARGRVRGTENLIVADASLMPTIPSANIHLPTLMIGERFGEWLR